MSDIDDIFKRHSACDECRKRKLKCSGQSTGCTRCVKQNLTCHYSIQKPMGRPRKRQKVAEVSQEDGLFDRTGSEVLVSRANGPSEADQPLGSGIPLADQSSYPNEFHDFTISYVSPPPAPVPREHWSYEHLNPLRNSTNDVDSDVTPPSDSPTTPSLSTIAESFPFNLDWNDYPSIPHLPISGTNPQLGKTSPSHHLPSMTCTPPPANHYPPSSEPSSNPFQVAPSCTCLADLYLTLSTLSTLSSLPINPHTVETLQIATRTAHTVLYCPTCPQKFQSSMQNVMLLSTLVPVIADSWSRILRAPAKDLARGFDIGLATALSTDSDLTNTWTDAKEAEWKLFARYLVRQYVFGDAPPPGIHLPGVCPFLSAPSTTSPSKPPLIILSNLCDAMERRQKTWHGLIEERAEFPRPFHSAEGRAGLEGGDSCGEEHRMRGLMGAVGERKEHLCLKIVEGVRHVVAAVDRRPDKGQRSVEQCRLNAILGR